MGISNGEIKAPLGVNTLANYFGTATDTFSICKASIINKWAKYKPIALSTLGLTDTPSSLTEAQRKAANYGLQAKSARSNSKADLPEKIMSVCGESGLWTYPHVVAGTDYARLDDFVNPNGYTNKVGYTHSSGPICIQTNISDYRTVNQDSTVDIYFSDRQGALYPGQIHFNELVNFGTDNDVATNNTCLRNCYLCFMTKLNNEYYYFFSEDTVDNLVKNASPSGWEDSDPMASLPITWTDKTADPFRLMGEGENRFTGYLCLIDLANAFNGEIPSNYKGGCVAQSSLISHAYYVYSIPVEDPLYTKDTFIAWRPSSGEGGGTVIGNIEYDVTWEVSNGKLTGAVTIKNKGKDSYPITYMCIHAMPGDIYDSSDYEHVKTEIKKYETTGEANTSGIYYNGSYGEGFYTRAQGVPLLGNYVVSPDTTNSYSFTILYDSDSFGHPFDEYTVFFICVKADKLRVIER